MNYADLLKSYIKQSPYTLDELSEKLEKRGISASLQYLSRLQNGKNPPASDELNRAIAEITGGDPEELIFAAYLEKVPDELKDYLKFRKNFDESLIEALELSTDLLTINGEIHEPVRQKIIKLSESRGRPVDHETYFRNPDDIKKNLFPNMDLETRIWTFKLLVDLVAQFISEIGDPLDNLVKNVSELKKNNDQKENQFIKEVTGDYGQSTEEKKGVEEQEEDGETEKMRKLLMEIVKKIPEEDLEDFRLIAKRFIKEK